MVRISHVQLFCLIVAFEVGSTTLFAMGIGAKQDAWIVILTAFVVSLLFLLVLTQFPKYYPDQNFSEILDKTVGRKLAKLFLFFFGFYFLSQSLHNFYEFGVLINLTALPKTPLLVILYLFILVIIYILSLGFEVFSRTVEILLPYLLLFLILTMVVNLFSGNFEFENLQPILGSGLMPVVKEVHTVIAFPFGEMVLFLMFWHYVRDPKSIRKTALLAFSIAALLLTLSTIVMICVLGPELTANLEVPLLETLLSINIADIITNLDSIGVFIMFLGGFFKTALHFFGACLAFTWLFNGSNPKHCLSIIGLILPIFAVSRFTGLDDQRWKGFENGIYSILLYACIPILLLIITVLKNKKFKKKEQHDANR